VVRSGAAGRGRPEAARRPALRKSRGSCNERNDQRIDRPPLMERSSALQEFYRRPSTRQHFAGLADLGAQFQGWLQTYNTRHSNHGDFCPAARPLRSWRHTYHDHAQGPSITSTRGGSRGAPPDR
jgi:hypothetical protein